MASVVVGALASTIGAAISGTVLQGALLSTFFKALVTNVVLGVATGSFSKKKDGGAAGLQDRGLTSTVRQPISARRHVYGRVRISGPIVYLSMTDENKFLHMIVAIASHPCEEIETVYFDEDELSWDKSTGAITTPKYLDGGPKAWVYTKLGDPDQTAMQELLDNAPTEWTSDHRLRNITYAYVKLEWNNEIFQGIPNLSFIVKGKNNILDPRTSTTGYTDNAALCTLDYLKDSTIGLGLQTDEWDSTAWQAEANTCDELVALNGGGNEKRFTMNGVISSDDTLQDNINSLLTATAGKFTYRGGKFYLLSATYRTPTVTLTNEDIVGDIQVSSRLSRQELFNSIRGVYSSPDNHWQPTDFPIVKNSTYITEDNSEQIWRDFELRYTITSTMAQRIAKIELERNRQQITVLLTCTMKAFKLAVGDTVYVTDTDLGWTQKEFEVVEWEFTSSETAQGLLINLALRETSSSVYDWNSGEETSVDPAPDTNLPNPLVGTAPTNVVVDSSADQLLVDGATVITRALISWSTSEDQFVTSGGSVEIQHKKSNETNWTSRSSVPGDNGSAHISPVEDGAPYDFRVRFKNSIGSTSTWVEVLAHTIIGKTAAPSKVAGFSVSQNEVFTTFRWNSVPDVDLAGYEIRYGLRGTVTWDNGIPLTAIIRGTSITLANIPPGDHTFMIKAKDTLGIYSELPTQVSKVMTQANYTTDTTLNLADDGWTGVLENFLVHAPTNSLVPDSLTQGDSAVDIFDNSNLVYYDLAKFTLPEMDLGSEKSVRAWGLVRSRLMADTTGTNSPRWQIRTRGSGTSSSTATLTSETLISSQGTYTNCVRHHTNKIIPDSLDLASVDGTMDEFVQNAFTTCTYESEEIDLGADSLVNVETLVSHNLGPGETDGVSNVTVELDYRTAAGAYDGFEGWTFGQILARYVKIKLITDSTQGKTVINSATIDVDSFEEFTGVGDYDNTRYVQLRLLVDTTQGVSNITDYEVTVDTL